jgi:hypothetical protein
MSRFSVLTIYAPMIYTAYTAPCVMFWFGQIQYAGNGRGLGPGKREFFGYCEMASIGEWMPSLLPPPPPPRLPTFPPLHHPELIRNQQQTVRRFGTKFWNNILCINAHVRYNLNVHSAVSIKNLCPSNLKVILHLFFHCPVSDRYRKKIVPRNKC